MRSILVVVSALVALTSPVAINAQPPRLLSEQQYAKEFTGWITIRNITYSQDVLDIKFNTYKDNYDFVADHNARYVSGEETFEVALNSNADMSLEEFRQKRLGFKAPSVAAANDVTTTPVVTQDIDDPACDYPNSCPAPSPRPPPSARSSTGGRVPTVTPSSSSSRVPSWRSSSTGSAQSSTGRNIPSSTASSISSSTSAGRSSSSIGRSSSSSTGMQSSSSSSTDASYSSSSSSASSDSSASSSNSSSSTGSSNNNNSTNTRDWRNSGFVGAVTDQGSCGSCWAFASAQSMQSTWAQKTGELLNFSEQELIDCVNNGQSTCDTGGIMDDSWKYLLGTGNGNKKVSPMPASAYPFTEKSGGGCKYDATKATDAIFTKYVQIPAGDEKALKNAVDIVPGVAVAINSGTTGFMFYKSGVLNDKSCGGSMYDLTHAVTVVGYGTDEKTGYDYWLIKNSWGTTWGLDGYMKLRRGASNMCGVASWASYIVA